MDSNITWQYQIEDHYCKITWLHNKIASAPTGFRYRMLPYNNNKYKITTICQLYNFRLSDD